MTTRAKANRLALVLLLACLLFAVSISVRANGITNYAGRLTIDSGTAQEADFNSDAINIYGYGSVLIQVTQDMTDATDSAVYTLKYSIDPVACSSVTNWYDGIDIVNVANPAVAAGRYLSYTVSDPIQFSKYVTNTTQATSTVPIEVLYGIATETATFTETQYYADVAAVAGSATRATLTQQFTLTGDGSAGYEFDTHGAWCLRINGNLTLSRTVTTTIYAAPVDIYE